MNAGARSSLAIGGLIGALGMLGPIGCQPTTSLLNNTLQNPRDLAVTCVAGGKATALSGCSDDNVRAFVSSGSRGSIDVGRPHSSEWLDNDPAIPGYTPLPILGLPQHVTVIDSDPAHAYITLPVRGELARMDVVTGKETGRVTLGFSPAGVLPIGKQKRIYITDPSAGTLWYVDLTAFDGGGKPVEVSVLDGGKSGPIGGSPHRLAWVDHTWQDSAGSHRVARIYIGHLHHGHITVLDADTLALVQRLPIDAQCSDGIDNDKDGLTDRFDSGCDDERDGFEGNPELGALCNNQLDDDGDGNADALDLGCQATGAHAECRDGIDNDGDGKTDYPADEGCSGFAGTSESRDNPSCNDGIDNDGDGKTDMHDAQCTGPTDDTELAATDAGVIGACGDGIDNDLDGDTDTADSDCPNTESGAEARPVCADGADNDGDGLTDTDDPDCYNRASPSEVAPELAPSAVLAASDSGRFVMVGHRRRGHLLVLDARTGEFMRPLPGQTTPFTRASLRGAAIEPAGIDIGLAPLAIAPVQFQGKDAFMASLELGGLRTIRLFDADNKLSIGIVERSATERTQSGKPSLQVGGAAVDMATVPPRAFASFGPLVKNGTTADGSLTSYGLAMNDNMVEHRTEPWRFTWRGRLPGTERDTGRFVTKDTFIDTSANFCRLGVVPGDVLLVHRAAAATDCGGWTGETLRFTVNSVGSDKLVLRDDGVVDVPVTVDTQAKLDQTKPVAVPLPTLSCLPRSGITYEVRASQWLVTSGGNVTGTSRARTDAGCAPWSLADPAQAGRMVEPELKLENGKAVALGACPIDEATVASALVQRPYGGGEPGSVVGYKNAVFSGRLLPGCSTGLGTTTTPRLLPSIRDMTWSFPVATGFRSRTSGVGVLAVAIASHPKRGYVYVIDQGAGSMHVVRISDAVLTQTLH